MSRDNTITTYDGFTASDDGRFQCLAMTTDDGRYIVITNRGGMNYPTDADFMVCVYRDEEAFGGDPTDCLFGTFTSDTCANIDEAVEAAQWRGLPTWELAFGDALQLMRVTDLEPTSALKQCASHHGISYGPPMRQFLNWAFNQPQFGG